MNGFKKSITWSQIFAGWPILVTISIIILSYAALITRITVVENKLDRAIILIEKYEANQNDLSIRLTVVETEHAMNRK